jgi:hypothetical protein
MTEIVNEILGNAKVAYKESVLIENEIIEDKLLSIIGDAKVLLTELEKNTGKSEPKIKDETQIELDEINKIMKKVPHSDLNEDIQVLYYEATNIFNDSPKGATAILRLALKKLLIQLGKEDKSINDGIKELIEEGLNPKMQQVLDFLRVVGNNAVHPGQIDLDDNKEMALKLFKILNMIADDMITKPKDMNELYNDIIPEEKQENISFKEMKTHNKSLEEV